MVFFPGLNYFAQTSFPQENPPSEIAFLVRSGRVVLWPVYKGSCERWVQGPGWKAERGLWIQRQQDLGRSLDYLQERSAIDREKLAYFGLSRGAWAGPLSLALNDRVKVGVLACCGLLIWRVPVGEMDPINFVSHVRVPVLMLNGKNDPAFPLDK